MILHAKTCKIIYRGIIQSLQIKSQVFIIFSDSSGNMPKKFNILEKKVLKNNNRQEIVN